MWTLIESINKFVWVLEILIIIRIFISFINRDGNSPIVRFIYQITEPILAPCRKLIYKLGVNTGVFDFSPLLAFFLLRVAAYILQRILLILWL